MTTVLVGPKAFTAEGAHIQHRAASVGPFLTTAMLDGDRNDRPDPSGIRDRSRLGSSRRGLRRHARGEVRDAVDTALALLDSAGARVAARRG